VPPQRPYRAFNAFIVSTAGIAATTVTGSLAVIAVYVPLRHAHIVVQWLLVFVLMVGESAGIHLPSEVILPAGGWLVVRDHHLGAPGLIGLSAVGAAGNTLGSGLLYLAGLRGGRPLVRRFGRYVLVGEEDIDGAERRMRGQSNRALFVSRLLPVVRTYSGFVAGLLRIPPRAFVMWTFVGSFVWCGIFVALGDVLGKNWSVVRVPAEIGGGLVAVLLVLLILAGSLARYRKSPAGDA
jgi:membrane protein DedA with SNARE-associated domain